MAALDRVRTRDILFLALQLCALGSAAPSGSDPQPQRSSLSFLRSSYASFSPSRIWSDLSRPFYVVGEGATGRQDPAINPAAAAATTSLKGGLEITTPAPSRKLLARYADQLVLRFNISTRAEALSLAAAASTLYLDVWGQSDDWVDVRLSKPVVLPLLSLLPASLQHAHKPIMQGSDLARAVADTYPKADSSTNVPTSKWRSRAFISMRRKSKPQDDLSTADFFFEDYRPLSIIEHWMGLLLSIYPSHVRIVSIGTSYEGRNIPALRVGVHPQQQEGKRKTVVVTGGQHAREWISTSTVSFVAHSLITSFGKDPAITSLIESLDFVFIPTMNPDGYQYSWDTDRLWRKNRQPTALRFCRGIDLDRNWAFMWDGNRTKDNPCSESFAGEAPFEAVEARRLADWVRNETQNNNAEIAGLLDLHSYSEQILYPYGYSCDTPPPTQEDLQELAQGLAKSIRFISRERYTVLPACEGNVVSGGAVLPRFDGGGGSQLDWFYHELGVRKAFQIKLRDKGSYGFLLPRDQIIPTGLEILNLVRFFGEALIDESSASVAEGAVPAVPAGERQTLFSAE